MYWKVPMVILCLMVSQALGDNNEYVFVIRKSIECISNPVNDICPIDHKVPDIIQNSPWINRTSLSWVLNSTSSLFRMAGGNASCIEANEMFQCSQFLYTCKDDEDIVYLDSKRTNNLCNAARKKCMGIDQGLLDRLFNCTLYTSSTKYNKGSNCKEYKKVENDTCAMPNYKVPSVLNFTEIVNFHQNVRKLLKQNNVGINCTGDVLEALCHIGYPACSRDGKYTVSLLGKQKCNGIINCLNSTNSALRSQAMQLCRNLPDEHTAKNFSIHEIENTPPTTRITITTPNTTTKISTTCCKASRLSVASHILMVFITLVFMDSFK